MYKLFLRCVFLCFFVIPMVSLAATKKMPNGIIKINQQTLNVKIAANNTDRHTGLMFSKKLSKDSGMLFLFKGPGMYCMWMKNTHIPLSVAFIDEHGVIVNIEDMQPDTENTHCAKSLALYVLEMNKGWFDAHGVHNGQRFDLSGIKNIKAK